MDAIIKNKSFKNYIILAILIALASEVHFYPLNSLFRISLGIILINVIGLVREDIDPLPLILLSGSVIFAERLASGVFLLGKAYEVAFLAGLPSMVYYIIFAFLFKSAQVYKYKDQFFRTLMVLAFIDIISNGVEAFIRSNLSSQTIMVIVMVGLIRSFVAYAVYFSWRRKELFILKQEHQKRYSQLNMLVANVEAELFYLQKSSAEIEGVMSKCYALYDEAKESDRYKEPLLDISKDIHDIKKDYLRVLSGFQDFVSSLEELEHLSVGEIFEIMKVNYNKVIKEQSLPILIHFEQKSNPIMENYLSLFTILNNLIDNSIFACKTGGVIHVAYKEVDEAHQFIVMDTGIGMSSQIKSLVFNPGFTTKYNAETGQASTGIGLTHVKNTVDSIGGLIQLDSIENSGTKCVVMLPNEMTERRLIMSNTFVVIDDDINIRTMLKDLIVRNELGRVFCELSEGNEAANEILFYNPDVVIIDMLLPGKDGITIIEEAIAAGYRGKFIMISQVEDRHIISKAYKAGVVFFISKPINSIEVVSVVNHVVKSLEYEKSFRLIKSTVYNLEDTKPIEPTMSYDKKIDQIFSDIGIINERGAKHLKDIIIKIIKKEQSEGRGDIVLKPLYDEIIKAEGITQSEVINARSLEQKIRRTVSKALSTIALIGIEDYYNIKFMDYSTILFDLKQVKQEMKFLENESSTRGKINIKKFIEGVCAKIK